MKNSRRSFLYKVTGGMLGAGLIGTRLVGRNQLELTPQTHPIFEKSFSPNDTIRLAAIGMGIMGFNNCNTALKIPGVELTAVCDLYNGRLERAKEVYGSHLFTTRDYRQILSRKDIDAVVISTSDHWHDRISIEAMNSGKAVYCEKPMVHHIEEGKSVIEAEKRTGLTFQVGSQGVSSIINRKANELYKQGAIGQLVAIESWNDRQSALGAWQYSIPPDASPATVDWDAYLGDAPKHPFDKVRFFRWRNYQDYGTGVAGDLYVHLFSRIHVILDSLGPERIYSSGGLRYWKDGRDVPDVIMGIYDYPDSKAHPAFNLQLRCNFVDGSGGSSRLRMVGSEGTIELRGNSFNIQRHKMPANPGFGGWDSFSTFSASTQKQFEDWYATAYPDKPQVIEPEALEYKAPDGYDDHLDHWANFFTAMRGGPKVVEDASFGLRAAAPALASNVSYFERRVVQWDPVKMELKA